MSVGAESGQAEVVLGREKLGSFIDNGSVRPIPCNHVSGFLKRHFFEICEFNFCRQFFFSSLTVDNWLTSYDTVKKNET